MNILKYKILFLFVLGVASAPSQAGAQPVPQAPIPGPHQEEPAATASEVAPPSPPPEPALGPTFAVAPGKGLSVTSADNRFQLALRSRIQLRTSLTRNDEATTLEAQVRTLRLVLSGFALVPELKYTIQFAFGAGDFERDSASPMFDAFVEYTKIRDLNVRAGQFFVPFDRARTIREFALQFVDRQGVVRELTLDRDVGVMLSSQDLFGLDGRLAYALFVGGGDGRNRVATSTNAQGPQKPGVLVIGRLMVKPFGPFDDDQEGDLTRGASPRLAVGVAGGYNFASDRERSTYGATYTLGTFDYAHTAADLVFKWRGFSLLAEFLFRKADREQYTAVDGEEMLTEQSRSGYGYFAQFGQMLTSQLELTGRWEQLEGTDPALRELARGSGHQLGGGLNLYLNGHALKFQSDYFYVFGSSFDQGQHVARLQLDASF